MPQWLADTWTWDGSTWTKQAPATYRGHRLDRVATYGRRDVREDMKTRAAERTVMIPDIAMPAVRRLADRGAAGHERSDGRLYSRLINGDRGGYMGTPPGVST
jgi:hypothetical protein